MMKLNLLRIIQKNIESIATKVLSETKDVAENVKSIIKEFIGDERYNEIEEIEIIDDNNGNTDDNNGNTNRLLNGNSQSNSQSNSKNSISPLQQDMSVNKLSNVYEIPDSSKVFGMSNFVWKQYGLQRISLGDGLNNDHFQYVPLLQSSNISSAFRNICKRNMLGLM